MRRIAIVLFFLVPLATPAEALTIRDVIELTRAGVSEEVLLALIEVDRGVFTVDTPTIKTLTDAGVSQRVIVALVRSGRERPLEAPLPVPAADPEPPPPQVIVVDHHEAPEIREVVVPVPVYVPVVRIPHRRHGRRSAVESTFVPFQSGPPAVRPVPVQERAEPVYWGFGGKRRPDTWEPAREGRKRDR